MMETEKEIDVTVSDVVVVNDLVKRFHFKRRDGADLPAFSGGAHIVVEMDDDGIRRLNPYSLMGDPFDLSQFTISVRRDAEGRGGSRFMHDRVRVGDRMTISPPINLFPLDLRASKHLMIAGGIGITPFLSQIAQLRRTGGTFELHYAARSQALASYADVLASQRPDEVNLYLDEEDRRIDLEALLARQPLGTHLYVCGPQGMIDWVLTTAEELGWPKGAVHHEVFLAPRPGAPFQVHCVKSDRTIDVAGSQSLLEALEGAGIVAPYLCRGGACGQCETDVLEADGTFVHRDHWLDEDDHASGRKIMPCVSRFEGARLVIDR